MKQDKDALQFYIVIFRDPPGQSRGFVLYGNVSALDSDQDIHFQASALLPESLYLKADSFQLHGPMPYDAAWAWRDRLDYTPNPAAGRGVIGIIRGIEGRKRTIQADVRFFNTHPMVIPVWAQGLPESRWQFSSVNPDGTLFPREGYSLNLMDAIRVAARWSKAWGGVPVPIEGSRVNQIVPANVRFAMTAVSLPYNPTWAFAPGLDELVQIPYHLASGSGG